MKTLMILWVLSKKRTKTTAAKFFLVFSWFFFWIGKETSDDDKRIKEENPKSQLYKKIANATHNEE